MADARPETILQLPPRLERWLLLIVGVLASTILLKIAGVQYLEIVELAFLAYLCLRVIRAGFRLDLPRPLSRLGMNYAIVCAIVIAGQYGAFQRTIYLAGNGISPKAYSISRLIELICDSLSLICLSELFRRHPASCRFTMRVYFVTGAVSALLSIPVVLAKLSQFPLFIVSGRASGFYNEGGPYGLYLISVLAVGWVLFHISKPRARRWIVAGCIVCGAGLLLSASKAAFVGIVLIAVVIALSASSLKARLIAGTSLIALVLAVAALTPVVSGLAKYLTTSSDYVKLSHDDPKNLNVVAGRVAGIYIVPRMIAQRPLLGVGIGLYGYVRNAYEYRGDSVWTEVPDGASLGLFGYAAEIGVPATLYILFLTFWPMLIVRRVLPFTPILALALVQPVVHLAGAQLNLTYPWISTAFALGLAGAVANGRNDKDSGDETVMVPAH